MYLKQLANYLKKFINVLTSANYCLKIIIFIIIIEDTALPQASIFDTKVEKTAENLINISINALIYKVL